MIKGCSKKVIVVKNTGSNMFEEAYFIINPKENARKHSDFLAEANRIIALRTGDTHSTPTNKRAVIRGVFLLLSGFLIGVSSAITFSFILT